MEGPNYGRPVGLNIFNAIKSGMTHLKESLGNGDPPHKVGSLQGSESEYADIVWETRVCWG
jgi:hypothetical protein